MANAENSFASRKDTLSLKTLSPREARAHYILPKSNDKDSFSLRTDDISGASPTRCYVRQRVGDLDPYGIEASNARARERESRLPHHEDWMLKTSDIDGAGCKIPKSRRSTNPLVPDYKLPTPPPVVEYFDPAWNKPAADKIGCSGDVAQIEKQYAKSPTRRL